MFLEPIRNFIRKLNRWRSVGGAYLSYAISFLRSPHQVINTWTNGEALRPRVAVFVHFDKDGIVQPFVLAYLKGLRANGFSVIFVTNSGKLEKASAAALHADCAAVLVRRNVGYDFGAMRDGLRHARLPQDNTEMVLVANDSVYGPLGDMGPMFERIDFNVAEVWGATESYQNRYHLQSFFLVAGRNALVSKAWKSFWTSVRPVSSKIWVISRYEVGMTQSLMKGGLRCAAIYPYKELVARIDPGPLVNVEKDASEEKDPFVANRKTHLARILHAASHRLPLNPTAELWRQLLDCGFPFLKRELLRDNPAGVIDVADWRALVDRLFKADISLIEYDLQRVLRDRAP